VALREKANLIFSVWGKRGKKSDEGEIALSFDQLKEVFFSLRRLQRGEVRPDRRRREGKRDVF